MKFAAIFPGQGSQKVGMGKDFFDNSDIAKEMIQEASARLKMDFEDLLFRQNDKLELTQFAQPAILLVSSIAYKLFSLEINKEPKFFLGHSLGEFSAVCASGAMDYLDAIDLVFSRGLLMSEACEDKNAGMMALLGLDDETVESLVKIAQKEGKKIWTANYNCDGQIVLAGDKSDLKEMESIFKNSGAKRAIVLNMSVASHCPILANAQVKLATCLDMFIDDTFNAPIISNVTAKPYDTKSEAVRLLSDQLVKPVLYKQSIKSIEDEVDKFFEFGGTVLKGINRKITKKETLSIVDMDSLEKAILDFNK